MEFIICHAEVSIAFVEEKKIGEVSIFTSIFGIQGLLWVVGTMREDILFPSICKNKISMYEIDL